VSVKSGNNAFKSTSNVRTSVSSNIISLKPSGTNSYIPLTNSPTPLLFSDNDDVVNNYTLDLKMDTPWNAEGGQYGLNLIFSISAQ